MKRIIGKTGALLLVFLMSALLLFACKDEKIPPPTEPSIYAELTYEASADGGEYTVTGIKEGDTRTAVKIPDEHDGIAVTEIASKAFEGTDITELTVGNNVKKIGNYAFSGCASLVSVSLGSSLERIGNYTFRGCESLDSIEFNEKLDYISSYAFLDCTALKSVALTDGISYMGVGAFSGCTAVESVKFGTGLAEIPHEAFFGCVRLKFVTFSEGLTDIGAKAFENCTLLGITRLDLPSTLKAVGNSAFKNCTSLSELNIGENLVEIGAEAFFGCSSLYKIRGTVVGTDSRSFAGCTRLSSVTIGTRKVYKKTYGLSIGSEAFLGCTSLKLVKIEEGVTQVGYSSFMNCTSLASVVVPKSIISMGQSAWQGCRSLSGVYYMGTPEQFSQISINQTAADYFWKTDGNYIYGAPRYYYSESIATGGDILWQYDADTGKYVWERDWLEGAPRYWRYNAHGKPTPW